MKEIICSVLSSYEFAQDLRDCVYTTGAENDDARPFVLTQEKADMSLYFEGTTQQYVRIHTPLPVAYREEVDNQDAIEHPEGELEEALRKLPFGSIVIETCFGASEELEQCYWVKTQAGYWVNFE